ncbi:hypothetical protein SKAU_G00410870 [Synaphobranchus kaupii]|uniref:HECT domain-containing protein n=1 Tax=Synaphobranchus kaupii TaxID=118154 RepID=A0A9Q1E7Q9_SYNKA|nr:hypothetical protein SKAU_G00410870 [Synaphobranchus kaupii]
MDQFLSALRERGVPEENLTQMAEDKIDQDIVKFLGEEKLSIYIPRYGDRVFAKNWRELSSSEMEDTEQRKKKLINSLREKMKLPSTASATATSSSHSKPGLRGNKNAEKKTRKIELGWMNYQDSMYKQVRRPTGGGTREIVVRKDDTVSSILEKGKTLFFPDGTSMKGKLEDFECMLSVIGSEEPLEGSVTIGSLYEQTNHKILRVYLCTKPKDCSNSELSDAATDMPLSPDTSNTPEPATHASPSSSSPSLVSPSPVKRPRYGSRTFSWSSPNTTSTLQATPASQTSGQPLIDMSIDDEVIVLGYDTNMPYNELVDGLADTLICSPLQVNADQPTMFVETTVSPDSPWPVTSQQLSSANTVFENQIEAAVVAEMEEHVIPIVDSEQASTSTINSGQASTSTMAIDFFANPENIVEKQIIVIRKVHCLVDMIEAFTDNNILDANISIRRVLERGEVEAGVGSGVIRDCLTDFWDMFYATKTCGTTYKIPSLHHKFKEREWAAVARILAFGWQRFQFFPVQLAPPFLTEALSLSCSDSNLLEAFFNYISATEKDVLTEALGNFKGADMDELLSILSSHNCSVLPTEENLSSLVEEIAHKEMVQEPAFIIKCWKPILRSIGQSMSSEGLKKILDDLKPKARNITKSIKFPGSMSPEEQTTSNHLLRFVRERDEKELGLFLRHCTGSDLFLSKTIKVTFTADQPQLTRAPLAHTCSCSLELASNYKDYADFRTEFISVLKSGVWVMDLA